MKEEYSVPPVDERCLFGIESGWYLERAKRWQMHENENEDNLKLN